MPKHVNIHVKTMDSDLEFSITPTTTGKHLFDQIVKTLGLREIWYFGLKYTDTKGYETWLKLHKKIMSQEVKKDERENVYTFKFRAKFYPEDTSQEIIQDITLKLFYLQVKASIVNGETYAPAETCILFASYAMQSKYGDYDPALHKKGCLSSDLLIPQTHLQSFNMTVDDWEAKIVNWWAEHRGMMSLPQIVDAEILSWHHQITHTDKATKTAHDSASLGHSFQAPPGHSHHPDHPQPPARPPDEVNSKKTHFYKIISQMLPYSVFKQNTNPLEDAMKEYLKSAQDLEMYGVNYFEIRNKKGTELYLGVDALGLNIYSKTDLLSPKTGFPWSEIRNISFNDKKFVIKPMDKKSPDFVFYAQRLRINKRILALCMGNHELYMRRRKSDSIEVQQMKAQAKEEKALRNAERERLAKEVSAREAAERKQKDYEERMQQMQQQMEHDRQDLMEAQETIARLEQQLRDLKNSEAELKTKEAELLTLTVRLQEEKELSSQERERLTEEVQLRQDEVEIVRQEVLAKTDLSVLLHEEAEEARRKQMEASQRLIQTTSESIRNTEHVLQQNATTDEKQKAVMDSNGVNSSNGNHRNENGSIGSASGAHYPDMMQKHEEHTDEQDVHINEDISVELGEEGDGQLAAPELERMTQAEKNQNMQERLAAMSADLESKHLKENATQFDKLHMENKRQGRDKYKTLRQIRGGNTKRRIDQYENM